MPRDLGEPLRHEALGDVPEGYLDNDPRFMLLFVITAGIEDNFRVAVYRRQR